MINLKEGYGKRYRVTWEESWEPGDDRPDEEFLEIRGKRGYIRPWGKNELELYLENTILANRVERSYPMFTPKNHYDDAIAFTFQPDLALVSLACRWIKARNRRQLSPEQHKLLVERLARMRSSLKKAP